VYPMFWLFLMLLLSGCCSARYCCKRCVCVFVCVFMLLLLLCVCVCGKDFHVVDLLF